jgi:hypothetical protein
MTRLSRAKTALGILCLLFFLLGSGSMMCVAPLISLEKWWTRQSATADPDLDKLLGLTASQISRRDALYREWEASNKRVEMEIRRTYYPKFQAIAKNIQERYRKLLTPEQLRIFEELSTGAQKRGKREN